MYNHGIALLPSISDAAPPQHETTYTESYFKPFQHEDSPMLYGGYGRMDEDILSVAMRRLQKEPTSLFEASAMGDRKGVLWLLEMGEHVNSKNEVHKIYYFKYQLN